MSKGKFIKSTKSDQVHMEYTRTASKKKRKTIQEKKKKRKKSARFIALLFYFFFIFLYLFGKWGPGSLTSLIDMLNNKEYIKLIKDSPVRFLSMLYIAPAFLESLKSMYFADYVGSIMG